MFPWSEIEAIEAKIREIENLQEQLGYSWDIDHEEHLVLMQQITFLRRTVALLGILVVFILVERLCIYFL